MSHRATPTVSVPGSVHPPTASGQRRPVRRRLAALGIAAVVLQGCAITSMTESTEPFGREVGLECDRDRWEAVEGTSADVAEDAPGFDTVEAAVDDWWARPDNRRGDRGDLDQVVRDGTVEHLDDEGRVVLVLTVVGEPGAYNVAGTDACV